MVNRQALLTSLALGCPLLALGYSSQANEVGQTLAAEGSGTLAIVANGEDFVRQGFVTKDGWRIDFDHVYVTLDNVKAYQTEPAFDPDEDEMIQAKELVSLIEEPTTVDLAAGGADADPISVTEKEGSAGFYNALSWEVVTPQTGDISSAIMLQGTAKKEGKTIDFSLNLDQPLAYKCGEYVGDVRKGFLQADRETELETTFHFDHIFGDAEAPMDDAINTGAVGFGPMAKLANNGTVNADLEMLQQELSAQEYQTLKKAIIGLGHVGEGHCKETAN
ncbi:hypothetical protein PCC7418_1029 [Halothece sp. PCC 7418]|uniref:hypothetical protein n=1 Tax=Halothece sp. (strain PCC 7418) TaxID=65093 RepID=UPI0002A06AD0|nr:hypothetical protein [Halothece sp. PCC 7418]AFZ43237.1 hypothetical protein PCC7418_1029 [Halothece sp. PCC 7418]